MNNLPLARHRDVVVQEFGKEILVYDLRTHRYHSLNETSSVVYRHCDGRTTFAGLKRRHEFSDDLIHLALDQLREVNLIEIDKQFVSSFNGMSRREAIRRVGLASMIALPFITSLIAPRAADAQSGAVCTAGPASPTEQGLGATCFCPPGTPAGTTCGAGGVVQPPGCKAGCACQADIGACIPNCSGTCV
jgi:hypothetical protein